MSAISIVFLALGSTIVGALLAAEIAVRLWTPRANFRDWSYWEIEHKVRAMDRLTKRRGASVVTIGSSAIQTAVNPELLSELLGSDRPAFNAALNGITARTMEAWTRDVVLPRLRPDTVVIGVDSITFNDNSVTGAAIFDRLVGSRPYARLIDEGSLTRRVLYRLERVSFLVRYRRFFRRPARQGMAKKNKSHVSDLGFLLFAKVFHQRPYQVRDRQIEIWRKALFDYEAGGQERAALDRLIDDMRARGVKVLLVKMPVSPDWIGMHPRGAEDFARFEHVLEAFVRERDVPYADLWSRFTTLDDFADPIHVNGAGQERFTRMLADLLADETIVRAQSRPTSFS